MILPPREYHWDVPVQGASMMGLLFFVVFYLVAMGWVIHVALRGERPRRRWGRRT
jgi:hypothetical protein